MAQSAIAAAIAAVAGLMRGLTGFGGALIMLPPLAFVLGARLAVPVTLLLEAFVAAPMMREAMKEAQWRVLAPMSVAACCAVPLGGYLLASAEPELMRRVIAAIVVVFSALILFGARYRGPRGRGALLALGGLSGTMLGAAGMGGPPVILFLLSGRDPVATTRANMTLYTVVIAAAGLIVLWSRGLLGATALQTGLLLAPGFWLGVVAGGRLFARFTDQRFRQLALGFVLITAAGVLFA
ncbi:MAG: sulfite exporter TauE/SafE family protein [Alphaproteobacteria bacterium]|nr:sulfite exporter TauE/SafE family protein [Alphaproteobacteria bacterium]